jgi:hypothetical protein
MRRIFALALLAGCSTDPGSQSSTSDLLSLGNDSCTAHVHLSVAVDTTAASLQARFAAERCRLDVDACVDLCNYEMSNISQLGALVNGVPAPEAFGGSPGGGADIGSGAVPVNQAGTGLTTDQCHVTFDGDTVTSDIHYDTFAPGPNCGFATAGAGSGSATPGGL